MLTASTVKGPWGAVQIFEPKPVAAPAASRAVLAEALANLPTLLNKYEKERGLAQAGTALATS